MDGAVDRTGKHPCFCKKTDLYFLTNIMGKHADSIDRHILLRIRRKGPGVVFAPTDFLDLGSRGAIDLALLRNTRRGVIRRVGRGLYDLPKANPRWGPGPATPDAIVRALARRDGVRIQKGGAHAAHALGLTDQVPMKVNYLTDGRPRKLMIGHLPVTIKRAAHRTMATAGTPSGDVIQALRWLGRRHIDDTVIPQLRRVLPKRAKAQLLKDVRFAPGWMAPLLKAVADDGGH